MMSAVWTLGRSYLVRNKVQNLFVALLILLSTLLVCTATIIVSNTDNRFAEMHERTRGSHQILNFERGLHDPELVHRWWQSQEGVEVTSLMRYRILSGIRHQGADILGLYMYMMRMPEQSPTVDRLVMAQGQSGPEPGPGTVWIPTSMASSIGISVGDTLVFQHDRTAMELTVSAIVVDVPYGAPFTNTARVWMNGADYDERFAGSNGSDHYLMGLRFADYDANGSYWSNFAEETGTPFLESKMEFEGISSFYLIINQIVGFLMVFLGAVMLLIALLTIGFTISDAILANYKTIGVFQSLGLTTRSTILTYVIQYGFLSIMAVLPGLAFSTLLARVVVDLSASSLSTPDSASTLQGIGSAVIVALSVFLLVLLCVVIYAKRARNVMPAQAIRYGMSETDSGRMLSRVKSAGTSRLGFGRLPVSATIGLRNLLVNRKGTAIMLVLTIIASSVLTLGSVVLGSIGGIGKTAAEWGYDSADVAAMVIRKQAFPHDEFENALRSDPRIDGFGWQGNMTAVVQSGSLPGNHAGSAAPLSIYLSVLDGSYEGLGFANTEGEHPRLRNEIALGVQVARSLDKKPGDTIDIYIAGGQQTMLVTGVYQAIANMSNSARITLDGALAAYPGFADWDVAFINLDKPEQAGAVVDDLNNRFKETASVVTQKTLLDSVYKEASSILVYPMGFIGILFLFATFLIIYSTCRINIRLAGKTYGIYKSIGMTSGRIRRAIALGIAAIATIGSMIGVLIGIYGLPFILETVLSGYGIVELPIIINAPGIVGAALICMAAAALGSWMSSKVVRDASPRMLTID